MQLDEAIEKRHSCRSFKSTKVDFKLVLEAIDAGLQGPFAGNISNLKFVITEDVEKIKQIAGFAEQPWIAEAPFLVAVCADDTRLEAMYGERGRVYSRQQAGAAIEHVLLKLTDLGLDSCWVGAYDDSAIKTLLDVPGTAQIEAILPIGYASGKTEKQRKTKLVDGIYWEGWDRSKRPTIFQESPVHKYSDK